MRISRLRSSAQRLALQWRRAKRAVHCKRWLARRVRIPVSGTKGMHGYALGATSAIETAICALIFERDYLPATVNLVEPDADCDLDYTLAQAALSA